MTTAPDRPATLGPEPAPGSAALMARIASALIGADRVLDTPFGGRRLCYADYTASGRPLAFLEDYLRAEVLPLYANTHTESSATGRAMTGLREEARRIIRDAAGAGDDTAVVFTGSGSTAAVDKLVGLLGLRIPAALEDRYRLSEAIPASARPVVLVGPYEHHSNELPWRESIADVVEVPADDAGRVDLEALAAELRRHPGRPLIGSFSAASNVTGVLTDTFAVARILHAAGALAFFDFAAAGPYVEIAMDGDGVDPATAKDAVFLSPHKFVGGPGTPGLLLVRRHLATNRVPVVPGGGTVAFVTPHEHAYLADVEHREEGGTPAIVESIRAGLVFQLKQAVGTAAIRRREDELQERAFGRWRANPAIRILGDTGAERLAIVSFIVTAPSGKLLHHNYVVALLNDLFGIQTRGGCSCAGPYGHRLLAIDDPTSAAFRHAITTGCEGLKPGWVRLNLNYFLPDSVADFLIEAVDLVATHGWRLLPEYRFDPDTGLWRHRHDPGGPRVSLDAVTYDAAGAMTYRRHQDPHQARSSNPRLQDPGHAPIIDPRLEDSGPGDLVEARTIDPRLEDSDLGDPRARYLEEARRILAAAVPAAPAPPVPSCPGEDDDGALDWFELPAACLRP